MTALRGISFSEQMLIFILWWIARAKYSLFFMISDSRAFSPCHGLIPTTYGSCSWGEGWRWQHQHDGQAGNPGSQNQILQWEVFYCIVLLASLWFYCLAVSISFWKRSCRFLLFFGRTVSLLYLFVSLSGFTLTFLCALWWCRAAEPAWAKGEGSRAGFTPAGAAPGQGWSRRNSPPATGLLTATACPNDSQRCVRYS